MHLQKRSWELRNMSKHRDKKTGKLLSDDEISSLSDAFLKKFIIDKEPRVLFPLVRLMVSETLTF